MTKTLYFVNTQTGSEFRVVRMDKEAGTITLAKKGETVEFVEPYNKDRLTQLGYTLVAREESQ